VQEVDILTGVIAPYFNLILFLVLAALAFKKPLVSAAAKKRQEFELAAKKAQEEQKLAEEKLLSVNAKLADLENQIKTMVDEAKLNAENEAASILASASALASHLEEEAKLKARSEVENAKQRLKDEIALQVEAALLQRLQLRFDQTQSEQFSLGQASKIASIASLS
jgi:F0F1-type ATP synthase membrane subunit b/b'